MVEHDNDNRKQNLENAEKKMQKYRKTKLTGSMSIKVAMILITKLFVKSRVFIEPKNN